jgi:hypothetical protein
MFQFQGVAGARFVRGNARALDDLVPSPWPRVVVIVIGPFGSGSCQIFWRNPTQIRSWFGYAVTLGVGSQEGSMEFVNGGQASFNDVPLVIGSVSVPPDTNLMMFNLTNVNSGYTFVILRLLCEMYQFIHPLSF